MKGIIYEISCNETNEKYIGSTIKSLKERIRLHIQKRNCASKQIIERNNYSVNILEEIECIDIKELRIREQFYINTIICINKYNSYNTDEDRKKWNYEYSQSNKQKEYRAVNKEKIREYKKQYYLKNKI